MGRSIASPHIDGNNNNNNTNKDFCGTMRLRNALNNFGFSRESALAGRSDIDGASSQSRKTRSTGKPITDPFIVPPTTRSNNMSAAASSNIDRAREDRRSPLGRLAGKCLIFMTIVSFLFFGLIINVLQFVLVITVRFSDRPGWRSAHKLLNGHLIYLLFAPPISLLYYWNDVKLNILLDDVDLMEDAQRPMIGLMIPNHSYELDYMICFVLADQLGNIGGYKSMSKVELRYLPIVGWALWMSDIIFVRRNWQRDRLGLEKKLEQLLYYEQILLGIFAEGTRWTPEKQTLACEYAHSHGLEPLKYHLIPRARGFNCTLRYLVREMPKRTQLSADKPLRLFNLQLAMPKRLDFKDFLNGNQIEADIYCEEVKLSDDVRNEAIESKDEDDCPKMKQLLLDIFRRKDQLVEDYRANGNKFSSQSARAGYIPFRRRPLTIAVWISGLIVSHWLFVYLALTKYAHSPTFWSILVSFIAGCALMLRRIEHESDAKHSAGQVDAIRATASAKIDKQEAAGRTTTDQQASRSADGNSSSAAY